MQNHTHKTIVERMILTLRTDKPEAELALFQKDGSLLQQVSWHAHRELSNTILIKIEELLALQKKSLEDIDGIVAYKGPGSFTGLRIGITVCNTLASTLHVPNVGTTGESWQKDGLSLLDKQTDPQVIIPEYGQEAHITTPRK